MRYTIGYTIVKRKGATLIDTFVPKPYSSDPITIRIPVEKLRLIDDLAAKSNLSRSKFLNQCIDYALEHIEIEND